VATLREQNAAGAMRAETGQFGRSQLAYACRSLIWASSILRSVQNFTAQVEDMHKQAGKLRLADVDSHSSDGYHVLIGLISVVAVTTVAILIGFSIEMLG
jgi:hypothetical protein